MLIDVDERNDLADEESIEWVAGFLPQLHRYVRETLLRFEARRRGRPSQRRHAGCVIVGWSNLRPDAPNVGVPGWFSRRLFWLKVGSDPYPGRCQPSAAVDPLTVAPGVRGRATERVAPPATETGGPL
jgi:hypothetical protein